MLAWMMRGQERGERCLRASISVRGITKKKKRERMNESVWPDAHGHGHSTLAQGCLTSLASLARRCILLHPDTALKCSAASRPRLLDDGGGPRGVTSAVTSGAPTTGRLTGVLAPTPVPGPSEEHIGRLSGTREAIPLSASAVPFSESRLEQTPIMTTLPEAVCTRPTLSWNGAFS